MPAVESRASDTDLLAEVEASLQQALARHALAPTLREAMQYATLGGGKRVRPILTLRACEAVGGRRQDAMHAAIALEMIHCFSLVHDDLPALDNDDLRRGRPTTHKAHGEALAILAGDALTSVAFEVALDSPVRPAEIARELGAATTAMISGQVYDTLGCFAGAEGAAEVRAAAGPHGQQLWGAEAGEGQGKGARGGGFVWYSSRSRGCVPR